MHINHRICEIPREAKVDDVCARASSKSSFNVEDDDDEEEEEQGRGDRMAVKSVETVGSTLKRAAGFALFALLVRQGVLLCTSKELLTNVQVRVGGSELTRRNQTADTMSLPSWLEDFENTKSRRGSGPSGRHSNNFSSLDDRAFQKYLLEQESEWKNGLAFCLLPESFKEKVKLDTWPLFARAWLRSFIFANLIYLGLGLTWAYYIYNVYGFILFPKGKSSMTSKPSCQLFPLSHSSFRQRATPASVSTDSRRKHK